MIFEGKPLDQILDDEIVQLVNDHIEERQNIEFKVTINHKNDQDRFETLCDLCSFANAGGGYLIIGIRDDGKGKAQRLETVTEPERIVKSIRSLFIDHISDRIEGIEIQIRQICNSNIILIRVPNSGRAPHMVTLNNNTHFVTRYQDGKHVMAINEIRSKFVNDIIGRRIALIEDGIRNISQGQQIEFRNQTLKMLENRESSLLLETDGTIVSEATLNLFRNEIQAEPYFRISVTPLTTRRDLINVDKPEVQNIINNPEQRDNGWNMDIFYSSIVRYSEGIYKGSLSDKILKLIQNGHMEFASKLDYGFCWKQSEEEFKKHPILYSIPMLEFPSSFLRLYKKIVDLLYLKDSFIVNMQYINLKGYSINPYPSNTIGYLIHGASRAYQENDIIVPPIEISANFNPDSIAFELIKFVYASFGYSEDNVPFYNKKELKFDFD